MINLLVIVDTFDDGFAWWVCKGSVVMDWGYDNDLREARRQANDAARAITLEEAEFED